MSDWVRPVFEAQLRARGYQADAAQQRAVEVLERCAKAWDDYRHRRSNPIKKLLVHPPLPRGVYLWGGVGRGKSFLMDCFYEGVPIRRKTRLHFHEFMREVHRELAALQGTVNPIDELGRRIALRYKLICFDEFHIADITDAMILQRILEALWRHQVGFVTTSNFHPDRLYPDGLHRERLLPAIELIKQRMDIVEVDAGTDYRRRTLEAVDLYLTPPGAEADHRLGAIFDRLASGPDEEPTLNIEARTLPARRRAGGVVWFDFSVLCGGPRSQNDYLELASQFHTVLLSGVPVMSPRMAAEARRFTWLVDVLYDRRVKLVLSAQDEPERLYLDGPMAHEFVRTASRLREMQSSAYLGEAHRSVDTALT